MTNNINISNLWSSIKDMEEHTFYTFKGLDFFYRIKGNEMFVNRKDKSITRATVELAYKKTVELDGKVVGPKKLGCFGASYIYPIFIELGIIQNIVTNENK